MPTSVYCLRWLGTSSELGRRKRREGGGTGYWVIVWMGPSLTVLNLSSLRRSPRRRRARRKRGRGTSEMKRKARSHRMASLLVRV